jgi:cytochrome b
MMNHRVKVWDPAVRIFHWLLVAAFLVAYLTEEDFLSLHVWAGYAVIGLLLFRIIWGFVGSPYARFSGFVCSPNRSIRYLMEVMRGNPRRYLGHNPAGSAMIVLLLASLALTAVTGLAVYAAEESAGPLAGIISRNGHFWEEVHEFFADATNLLVFVHLSGVLFESWKHKENLVKSMITGYKDSTSQNDPLTRTGSERNAS